MINFTGVGVPFGDRFRLVSEEFLEDNQLKKNTTSIANTKDYLDKTWKNAGGESSIDSIMPGGSCANVIKALAMLGNIHPRLIGKIGSDPLGDLLTERLNNIGVVTFFSSSNKDTGLVNCFLTKDHKRTMLTYLGGALEFCGADITNKKDAFLEKSHVHMEGYLVYYSNVLENTIIQAKRVNAQTSLDLSSEVVTSDPEMREKLIPWIKDIDIIFGNLQEVLGLTNTKNAEEALLSNIFNERQIVIITNGGKGCWIKESLQKKITHITLAPVDNVVDTTGAGDYFIAGFLDSYAKNIPLVKCAENGHHVASFVIQEIGTNLPESTWENLKTYTTHDH